MVADKHACLPIWFGQEPEVTEKVLKEQKVPRSKVADGIDLEAYKRCGWTKPIENIDNLENGPSKFSIRSNGELLELTDSLDFF